MTQPEQRSAPLDGWIIEDIRRREEEEQSGDRPTLEIPLEAPRMPEDQQKKNPDDKRGVAIVDFEV